MSSRSTTDLEQAIQDVLRFAGALEPERLDRQVKYWRRYGLPGGARDEGGRSSEAMLPLPDAFDERLKRVILEYRRSVDAAVDALRRARVVQGAVLGLYPVDEIEKLDAPWPCANPACTDVLEAGRQRSECDKCRRHRSRHGLVWPQQRAETA